MDSREFPETPPPAAGPPSETPPSPPPAADPASETPPPPPVAPRPFVPPVPLPGLGDYLRDLIRLGVRSIRPAMPALVLLFCYRFGMGLYLLFTGDATSPLGYPDPQARMVTAVVTAAAYLPLLVLVYTPFLPLQDSILRGERRSYFDGAKLVLELLPKFALSGLAQGAIIGGPAIAIIIGAAIAVAPLAAAPPEVKMLLVMAAMVPAFIWILAAAFFLSFAVPLLILDGRGPIASLRESFRLVRSRFGGLFGRLLFFGLALFLVLLFVSFPTSMLAAVSAVARQQFLGAQIAGLVWTSAVSAALFPFSVSALLVLYRAMVPAAAAPATPSTARPVEPDEPTSTTNPYAFE